MNYDETTRAAFDAAAAAGASVRREDLGDVCWGVCLYPYNHTRGHVAILATDPDHPDAGWGIYEGPIDREMDGAGWRDIPAEWGTDPAAIGAAFARHYLDAAAAREFDARLSDAVRRGLDAFWDVIGAEYSDAEIMGGDVPPGFETEEHDHAAMLVRSWLGWNASPEFRATFPASMDAHR